MLMHATLLQPYLSTQCIVSITFWTTALIFYIVQNQGDVIHYVASILELVVPLLDHPSEVFLARLEEDIIKLTMKQGQMVYMSYRSQFVLKFVFRLFKVV